MLPVKDFRSQPPLAIGLALIALLGSAAFSHAAATKGETIVLASGPSGGVYHRLAELMRDRLEAPDRNVRIEPKPDCAASLAWLEEEPKEGEVRFAFAQQDVVGERFRTTNTPVRVVGRVAYDYVHIFVRPNLDVQSIADLDRHRVWLGEEGSAVRFTAVRFLESVGVRPGTVLRYQDLENVPWDTGDLNVEDRAAKELYNWLRDERIDAAILVAPIGSPEVLETLRRGGSRLLPLTPPFHRKLLSQPGRSPFLRHMALGEIPKWTYANQGEPVSAAAVSVLLLAPEGTNADLAKVVRQAAQDAEVALRSPIPEPEPLASPGLKWLEGLEPPNRPIPAHIKLWITSIVLLGFMGLGVWQQQWIRRRWSRLRRSRLIGAAFNVWYQFSRLVMITAGVLLFCMLTITWLSWLYEHKGNENFSSFWEAWWSITLYIFSGLDQDRAPYTLPGRILGAAGLAIGWLLSIGVTSKTIAIFIRRERKMPPRLKRHLVLLNWNKRGMDIVQELHHPALEKHERNSVIVVLAEEPKLQLQQFSSFPDVYPSIGDPTSEVDLLRVNVHEAHTVIVLADENRGDEWAIRSVLKLRKIAEEHRDLHVVVELIDSANGSIIDDLASSFRGHLEAVSDRRLRTCVIAQAALIEGIAEFYMDLLSVGGDNNEVYTVAIPPEAASNWSFREYSAFVIKNAEPTSPIIPVGVQRKIGPRYKVFANPKDNGGKFLLKPEDRLVVIAYGPLEDGSLPVPPKRTSQSECSSSSDVPRSPQLLPNVP